MSFSNSDLQSSEAALSSAVLSELGPSAAVRLGVVVIGRNEGDFLAASLKAVLGADRAVVYVDSGSTDDSVALAKRLNVAVIELDPSVPFTAARAYNEGFDFLLQKYPLLQFVQFVDGDCIIQPDWLGAAYATLVCAPDVAVVCGRLREQHRNQSPYHLLLDIEWDRPLGEVDECAGNAMMRVSRFHQVGGFNAQMMAGEEPELCLRIRQQGGKILRIAVDAAVHDARMSRFSQWWARSRREGNAYAEASWLHGWRAENHRLRHSVSVWLWGFCLPLVALGTAGLSHGWSLMLLALYGPLWVGIFGRSQREHRLTRKEAAIYASFCLLGKFPQFLGQLNFLWHLILQKQPQLIEYRLWSPKR
jgi:GT2 family glycosyltransferase